MIQYHAALYCIMFCYIVLSPILHDLLSDQIRLMFYGTIWYHIIPYHIMLCTMISDYMILHFMALYDTVLYSTKSIWTILFILCCDVLYYIQAVIPRSIISCYNKTRLCCIMLCCTSCYTVRCYTMLHDTTASYAIWCWSVSRCATRWTMLRYVTLD